MKPSIRPWSSIVPRSRFDLSSRTVARSTVGPTHMAGSNPHSRAAVNPPTQHSRSYARLSACPWMMEQRPLRPSSSIMDLASRTAAAHNSADASRISNGTPISFLRAFSTTRPASSSISAAVSFTGVLLSRYPRLRSEDSPSRRPNRGRRYPSPLFDRPPPRQPSSSPKPGAPWPPSTSTLAAQMAKVDQQLFSKLPENFVLYAILALNFLVFFAWIHAIESLRRFSDPRAYIFMSKNFLSGMLNLREHRWWTLLTSCVSHQHLGHFCLNMVSLAFMAPPVIALTGPTTFLALYFGAGIVSSGVSIAAKRLFKVDGKRAGGFSHGASGSVYAITSTFALVNPTATFLVFFVVPAPAWAVVSGIFAWDLWNAASTPGGSTDSAGHVGGILAGALFWRFGLRGLRI